MAYYEEIIAALKKAYYDDNLQEQSIFTKNEVKSVEIYIVSGIIPGTFLTKLSNDPHAEVSESEYIGFQNSWDRFDNNKEGAKEALNNSMRKVKDFVSYYEAIKTENDQLRSQIESAAY
jgi:hypothetical protein